MLKRPGPAFGKSKSKLVCQLSFVLKLPFQETPMNCRLWSQLPPEELEIGLRSPAVPVFDSHSRAVAAINIGTQAARTSKNELLRHFLPVLRTAAKNISSCIGHL